jgi:ribonuclease BN (tRNA processing enzyme)
MVREWLRGVRDVSFPYFREKIEIEIITLKEDQVVHQGDLIVSNAPTLHGTMDTRAYKIEHEGKTIVVSSDTAPCREVIDLAKGCDVLVHECNWLDGSHPEGVHTSPTELSQVVEKASPKRVVLTHVSPEVLAQQSKVIEIVKRRTDAEVTMGEDLMELEL